MTTAARFRSVAAITFLVSSAAMAQTPSPTPSIDSVPEKIAPGAKPTEPASNLSEKLDKSNGVIHPKEVDPNIEKGAPRASDPNVIKPPGTTGGAPAPQAK